MSKHMTDKESDFNLKERKEIFYEDILAMGRANAEVGEGWEKEDLIKLEELQVKYHQELAQKYSLTIKQLNDIAIEGGMKGWHKSLMIST